MPFPPIRHCLICEEVRPEVGGKCLILGFFGVAPNVNLIVQDLTKPLEKLCFLLVCEPGEGSYKITMKIAGPKGEMILAPPEVDFLFPSPSQSVNAVNTIFGISGAQFPTAGKYRFILLVQGKEHFATSFDVSQANLSKNPQ
jgi:hypothetical protein